MKQFMERNMVDWGKYELATFLLLTFMASS